MSGDISMKLDQRKDGFIKKFGNGGDIRGYFAPGRVNLIGEHIDYNGGHVFPCALNVGTYCIARKRNDHKIYLYSDNCKRAGVRAASIDDIRYLKQNGWINYPLGVIHTFGLKGRKIDSGLDLFFYGDIPGSGLSSSASREVVVGVRLKDRFGFDVSLKDIALIGQYSENHFNGRNCGIRDQFASARGKEDNAIFLDCSTLSYEYVPFVLEGVSLVVANSNKPHSLAQSHYNERRRECERALKDLQKELPIKNLCDLTPIQFETYKHLIQDDICLKRASHAVYEEQRTKDAVTALRKGDLVTFGVLRNESGDSLRYNYDATCFEIDTLVEEARKQRGCLGSRETGGGWGGNTVSLVRNENVHSFFCNVVRIYLQKTGRKAKLHVMTAGGGGRRVF